MSATVVGVPVGIVSASLTFAQFLLFTFKSFTFFEFFSVTTGIIKKSLSIRRNKMKKHDKILMLAKSKLDSIETSVSQALIDMEIRRI